MHIPDGFLSLPVAGSAAALAGVGVAAAVFQANRHLPRRKVPLTGVAGAFVFAAQMLNFPVPGGTRGHLIGGVLCSVLLGPATSILVITAVLTVPCLVFADGGVLALGANVLNMAIVNSVGGYYVYRGVSRLIPGTVGRYAAVAFACWTSVVVAAVVCAGELSLSGTVAWRVAYPAMAGVHMLIGVGEAVLTTLVVATLASVRPDLLKADPAAGGRRFGGEVLVFGSVIAVGLALFVSPFACKLPDGLDRVAGWFGFDAKEAKVMGARSPMPDYRFPGVRSAAVATSLAGVTGTVVAFGLSLAMARLVVARQQRREADAAGLPPA